MTELGIAISFKSGRWSLSFDLNKIEQFKSVHGADSFVEEGCRYVSDQCGELGITDDLWLWLEAVRANR
ncbi:hypothetical protein [Bradyrhizobium sp. DOA9]|uniref:hypothetical protein n=1 Tax=Bradyrhizobium sp. DOA9 TaxID=1126627 RepID=UPI001260158F|nr:hypothetical protein [Bradyrhizobium sp. DOA9]